MNGDRLYTLCVYVPVDHAEAVKDAMFAAGGGRLGNYDCCCWQCPGEGQFRPLTGSRPFTGNTGEIKHVAELKIELLVAAPVLNAVVEALCAAHPYETPAYQFWAVNRA